MNSTFDFDPPTVIGFRPGRTVPPIEILGVARPIGRPAAPAEGEGRAPPQAAATGAHDGLVAAAAPLLALVARLSVGVSAVDVVRLRSEVIDRIYRFNDAAAAAGATTFQIQTARYVLCALIDEAVMTTPWGSASDWSTNSLLNRFHGETWGGENVFAVLERAKADPTANVALLRLIEVALTLGFEGMYRVRDDGRDRLDALREELRHILSRHLPPPAAELSENWRGTGADGTLRTFLPLWIVFAVAGFVLVCLYSALRYRVESQVAPVVATMNALERPVVAKGARP